MFSRISEKIPGLFMESYKSTIGRNTIIVAKTKEEGNIVLKTSSTPESLNQEINALNALTHPNIVTLKDYIKTRDGDCLILEYVPGVSLIEILVSNERFSEKITCLIMKQLVEPLIYMHRHGWSHNDIKPDNYIVNLETGVIKLIDFEFASKIKWWTSSSKGNKNVGTLLYSAPEVREKGRCSTESDIWSLGVTLFCLITGNFPFLEEDIKNGIEKIPEVLYKLSKELQSLILGMLNLNYKKRITIHQVQGHPWFQYCNVLKN